MKSIRLPLFRHKTPDIPTIKEACNFYLTAQDIKGSLRFRDSINALISAQDTLNDTFSKCWRLKNLGKIFPTFV